MTRLRPVIIGAAVLCAGTATVGHAASSPFGVGLLDPGAPRWLPWVAAWQAEFYQGLTAALRGLKTSGRAFPWLAGVSFIYGIVHAAGPGHGKVVISSYLLANEQTARRGVGLAFLSAMVQAGVAVALIGVMALVLDMTSIAITQAARSFEIGSYALITALGLYLLVRKGLEARHVLAGAPGHHHHGHAHDHGSLAAHGHGHACHSHACNHVPDPTRGSATAAILSVGLRPCSGALIVLVFALAQGIFWAGVASTFLMGLGTAITVAALAAVAVGAKDVARRLVGRGTGAWAARLMLGVEIMGAALIAVFGAVLLLGSLGV